NRPSTPVTVEEPLAVEVQGPVEVQGVVEVLNDILRQPYVRSINVASAPSPTANFDIPEGKRLVIESIVFQTSRPTNESNRVFMHPMVGPGQRLLVPLPIQSIVVEGVTSYLISAIPLTL